MSNTCQTFINPVYQEDQCGGEKTNNQCVIDTNTYIQLGLNANSTQQEINQALYTALVTLKNKVDDLEEIIDNL